MLNQPHLLALATTTTWRCAAIITEYVEIYQQHILHYLVYSNILQLFWGLKHQFLGNKYQTICCPFKHIVTHLGAFKCKFVLLNRTLKTFKIFGIFVQILVLVLSRYEIDPWSK